MKLRLLIVALLLAACATPSQTPTPVPSRTPPNISIEEFCLANGTGCYTWRVVDLEYGYICYAFEEAGIFCAPLEAK